MFKKYYLLLPLVLASITANLVLNQAYACLPPLGEEPASISRKAQDSAYVFDGVISAITENYVLVKVSRYFKGQGLDEVKISGFNSHSCSDYVIEGQRALFFTTGEMGGVLEAVYDGAFGSIRAMNAENFASITASNSCMAYYADGQLKIPCVAVQNTQQVYQATLQQVASEQDLQLVLLNSQRTDNIQQAAHVSAIEVLPFNTETLIVQVVVHGFFSDGCGRLGAIYINREEQDFNIQVTQYRVDGVCTHATEAFQKTLDLDMTGLSAGEYRVHVNEHSIAFDL